jgi:hypothetical protein
LSIPFIKQSCDQIALIESALYGTGCMMKVAPTHTPVRVFEVQKEFKPVIFINEYELQARNGLFPVKLQFKYDINGNIGYIITNRKGLDRLKEIMPETFNSISVESKEEEVTVEVRPYTKYQPKTA